MTTRALEDSEIKAIFEHVSGYNAKRNETILIAGIGMALRASELVGLFVGDVWNGEKVKQYVSEHETHNHRHCPRIRTLPRHHQEVR